MSFLELSQVPPSRALSFCVPGGQQHNHGMFVWNCEEEKRILYCLFPSKEMILHYSDTCKYIFVTFHGCPDLISDVANLIITILVQ